MKAELFDRLTGVSQVIQDTEVRFMSMFNEDKTLKPFTCNSIRNAGEGIGERYMDWLTANENTLSESIHCARMANITIEHMR
jgi:hypothetical protein